MMLRMKIRSNSFDNVASSHSGGHFHSCFSATTKTKEGTVAQQIPISLLFFLVWILSWLIQGVRAHYKVSAAVAVHSLCFSFSCLLSQRGRAELPLEFLLQLMHEQDSRVNCFRHEKKMCVLAAIAGPDRERERWGAIGVAVKPIFYITFWCWWIILG